MAKTKREYIIATFIISCAATIFSIVSMATEQWISADLDPNLIELREAKATYGLFAGTLIQKYLAGERQSVIKITCLFDENICGFSPEPESNKRITELQNILNKKSCVKEKETRYAEGIDEIYNNIYEIEVLDNNTTPYTKHKRYIFRKKFIFNENETDTNSTSTICDPNFLNAGLWVSTILFLSLSIVLSTVTATLSVVNAASNPISQYFNIWGLYIWNSVAIALLLITVCLWGAQFGAILVDNAAIILTLDGSYKNNNASLGFSYWLMLGPILLHIVNIGLLYLRKYLIDKEPTISEEKLNVDDKDGMIFVY